MFDILIGISKNNETETSRTMPAWRQNVNLNVLKTHHHELTPTTTYNHEIKLAHAEFAQIIYSDTVHNFIIHFPHIDFLQTRQTQR